MVTLCVNLYVNLVIGFGCMFVGSKKDSNNSFIKMRYTFYVLHIFYTCSVRMYLTVF
jgi:hypothetical protein